MKTSNLFTILSAWVLGVFLCMGSITAYAVDDLGLFELEGNAIEDGVPPPDDWETLCNPLGYPANLPGAECQNPGPGPGPHGSAEVFTGINVDPDLTSIFDGGKKDIQDVSQWSHKDGSVPDKDDITNAYAAAYFNTVDTDEQDVGDLIIYFGSDRIDANGDAFMGYWFFQDDVQALPDGTFTGNHIPGDVLVVTNYPQSNNAVPIIKVIEWDPDCKKAANNNPQPSQCAAKNLRLIDSAEGIDALCAAGAIDQLACAISNTEANSGGLNDPTPSPWPYLSKDGDVNEFPGETFLEGGINLSKLLPESSGCFSSFMAETRSSSSFTATLKDFRLDEFELCGIEADKFCDAEFSTTTIGSIDVDFNGYVENSGFLPLEINVSDDMGDVTIVCEYTGPNDPPLESDVCGNADTAALAHSITDGVAIFELASASFALYGGSYVDSSPAFDTSTGEFVLMDQVTAVAREVNVVVGAGKLIDTDSPLAECRIPGVPGITISKACSENGITGGDTSNFLISGGGTNNGDILLTNVSLSDTVLIGNGAITNLVIMVDGQPASDGFSLPAGSSYTYTAMASHTDGLQHQDSMSVTADNPFTGQPIPVLAAHTATTEVCTNTAVPSIAVTKVCEVFLDTTINPGQITVGVRLSGTVTNTGTVDLTAVDVDDRDAEVVAEVGQLVSNASLPVGSGPLAYGPFTYYPSSSVTEPGAGGLGFINIVDAIGTPPFGLDDVSAEATSDECLLCPELPDPD